MMLAFGQDVLAGRLDPRAVDDGWYLHSRRASIDSTLRAALEDEGFPDLLESLRPPQKEYRELVEILGDYRELLRDGGWAEVPGARRSSAATGDRGWPRCATRLRATGELDAPEDAEPVFDDEVAEAVARFQARHGIVPDSSVGAATLSALNVPSNTASARSSSTSTGIAGCPPNSRIGTSWSTSRTSGSGPTTADARFSSSG